MSGPTFGMVEKLLRAQSLRQHQRRAFIHGYVDGFQDAKSDTVIVDTGDLEDRTDRLFENYMEQIESGEVFLDG